MHMHDINLKLND